MTCDPETIFPASRQKLGKFDNKRNLFEIGLLTKYICSVSVFICFLIEAGKVALRAAINPLKTTPSKYGARAQRKNNNLITTYGHEKIQVFYCIKTN